MMTAFQKFKDQVQRNLVALISLVVAVTSLSYNTWRNEKSEYNRNHRDASFHLLLHLGEFRELVYHLSYDPETVGDEAFRSGWVKVIAIEDLAMILEAPLPKSATALKGAWGRWEKVLTADDGDPEAEKTARGALVGEIDAMRDRTLGMLLELD